MPTINQEESEGVRLLSFGLIFFERFCLHCTNFGPDGGDLSAVSQLIILEEVMCRIQWDRNSVTPILPCDYFHMMGGVGTGGLVYYLIRSYCRLHSTPVDPFSILTFEWARLD
jgi:hypothetical protein